MLKNLNHPNIINFINAWICKQKDEVIFITEIITGGSLKR
jgi:WNK lysine deficient protein kinase